MILNYLFKTLAGVICLRWTSRDPLKRRS